MKAFLFLAILLSIFLGTETVLAQDPQTESDVNPEWFGFRFSHPFFGFHHPFFGLAHYPFLPHPLFPVPKPGAMPPITPPETDTELTQSDLKNPEWLGFGYHHVPFLPKPGAMPPVNEGAIKCWEAHHTKKMGSCLKDFYSYLKTHKISVSSDCCMALENIEDNCKYKCPFLEKFVSKHCSSGASPPTY